MAYDFKPLEKKMNESREWLQKEYQGIRTGRATPTLLDGVSVTAYGSRMPLNQVANISMEDARTLRVVPWDAALSKDIERAITEADLGVGTGADDKGVRVTFPSLTSERRTQLIKIAKDKLEDARISIRGSRDEVWSDIQEGVRSETISEDDKFKLKEQMEKIVTKGNDDLAALFAKKETEITE